METRKLSAGQLLNEIKKNPGATSPELRKKLGVSANANLTYYFFSLMKKGLITREKNISVEPYSPWFRYYPSHK